MEANQSYSKSLFLFYSSTSGCTSNYFSYVNTEGPPPMPTTGYANILRQCAKLTLLHFKVTCYMSVYISVHTLVPKTMSKVHLVEKRWMSFIYMGCICKQPSHSRNRMWSLKAGVMVSEPGCITGRCTLDPTLSSSPCNAFLSNMNKTSIIVQSPNFTSVWQIKNTILDNFKFYSYNNGTD